GPNGWKKPNAGYWVDRGNERVWMSNDRYAKEALSKASGFRFEDDPYYRFGISAEPRPADIPEKDQEFDWSNPVDSAMRMVENMGRTWEASARQNPTFAMISAAQKGSFSYDREEYDVWGDLDGYEGYAMRFVTVENRNDADIIKRRIDEELKDREVLARSGPFGVVAALATGILDPINFIPIGGAATTARVGNNVLKGAGRVALAGAGAGLLSESILHGVQETRTLEESAYNIAGAALLSGLLGGAAAMLGGKKIADLSAAIEKEMDLTPDAPTQAAAQTIENATEIIEVKPSTPESAQLKDVGVDGPEVIREQPPTMDELNGAFVDYGGIQGHLLRSDDGAWYIDEVATGERVLVESGESGMLPEDIGVTRAIAPDMPVVKVTELNTYQEGLASISYDAETSTFTYHGKPYAYERVNMNKKGEVVSLTARNADGKEITIRNLEAVHTIELQKEIWEHANAGVKTQDITAEHIQEAFNELSAADKERSLAYAEKRTAGHSKGSVKDGGRKGKASGGEGNGDVATAKQPDDTGSAASTESTGAKQPAVESEINQRIKTIELKIKQKERISSKDRKYIDDLYFVKGAIRKTQAWRDPFVLLDYDPIKKTISKGYFEKNNPDNIIKEVTESSVIETKAKIQSIKEELKAQKTTPSRIAKIDEEAILNGEYRAWRLCE
ncbi:MAG: hypothetical protein HGB19_14015, partial [Chlorobiales bacterium]|nr:hypothetical protein [Chlorobiales bacterium]